MGSLWNEEEIAERLTNRFYEEDDVILKKFGDRGRKHTKEDLLHHFNYLKSAYNLKNEQVFVDYALWLHQILVTREVPGEMLTRSFDWIYQELEGLEENEQARFYQQCLKLAKAELV
ncbi:hypothetical protein CR194_18345 [Salipaludibacillus keqinensis]|uniref:Uncharacterized protein n=1 Tax=Salipaludibacillus keqinensis TaxID=2045207 RepID=A0A323T8I8_9BACI|nr:hypothetical protein [Salipaludibacillus keqinensis]PYZ91596.1 hypothetical protein CR194_18345 [Salipaludibacillus keqinensis]